VTEHTAANLWLPHSVVVLYLLTYLLTLFVVIVVVSIFVRGAL